MKKNRPLVAHALVALVLVVALALLVAGCRPAGAPVGLVEQERCNACLTRNCAVEAMACPSDPARALAKNEDGTRSMCLWGCRVLRHPLAWCLDHCGPTNATYDALASCLDANCADRCPQPKEEP